MITMDSLVRLLFEKNASDLHLSVGMPPMLRIDGDLVATDLEKIKAENALALVASVLTDGQKQRLHQQQDLKVSFSIEKVGRVRMSAFWERGQVAASLRCIPNQLAGFEELGLPAIVNDIVQLPKGLVLVCGPSGSGKSATLAAMINWINEHKSLHILTIESPLEFLHTHNKSVVNQREIGADVANFDEALHSLMSQDPDVVLIGDLQDANATEMALTVAETGHLVFATLPAPDSVQAISRLIEIFSPHHQLRIRKQLANTLQAILTQQLLPRGYSSGRVLACEVLIPTLGVRNLILEEKEYEIYAMMQTGSEYGMQTMNQSLFDLYQKQLVTYNEIFSRTTDPKDLQNLVKGTT